MRLDTTHIIKNTIPTINSHQISAYGKTLAAQFRRAGYWYYELGLDGSIGVQLRVWVSWGEPKKAELVESTARERAKKADVITRCYLFTVWVNPSDIRQLNTEYGYNALIAAIRKLPRDEIRYYQTA